VNLGDVFYWETNQAIGHPSRNKYHVFIKASDWNEENIFLFISSQDYGGDYRMTNPPYIFLPKSESYISCNAIVSYSDETLQRLNLKSIGRLDIVHILELKAAIENSFTMEQRHITLLLKAIYDALR
jgi:hypothetical protein